MSREISRATFTILPRSGPLSTSLARRAALKSYRVLTQIGRTFRISSEYGCSGTIQRSTKTWADESYTYCNMDVGSLGRDTLYIPP